ncbi:Flp pilus assembly protein CpaB [Arenicella xantha]|uniref:Flp pilus assembly protein CpaB n=1 Tax=Arenicella xantha TaxID=644221 RepID=A0A395JKZ9_9GAMM|nr:Flp pilus assembly protein CpaB [Arenicella xantha]RBP51381.1 Flp pilus assembly protein CpaB [Arenicella xantha]
MRDFLKSWGMLLVALVVGVLAFFTATSYLSDAEENIKRSLAGIDGETIDVVVASVDIAPGDAVSSQNLAVAQLSTANLSGAVVTPDMFDGVDGSLLKVPMSRGEPLLEHFLEGVLIERFSELLEDGQRAVTIEVDTLTSNAGLLSVGDHVDIFLSGPFAESETDGDGAKSNEEVLVPLYQRIKVVAVDRHPLLTREQDYRRQDYLNDDEAFDYTSVTLALHADNADNLAFASSLGEIVFLLRPSNDTEMRNWSTVDRATVLENSSGTQKKSYAFFGKGNQIAGGIKPESRSVIASNLPTKNKGRAFIKSLRVGTVDNNEPEVPSVEPDAADAAPDIEQGSQQDEQIEEQNSPENDPEGSTENE